LLLPFVENIYFSHNKESCTLPKDENMIIYDVYPDAGPMGGILTALEHFLSPVLTLPCDTPRIDHEILTTLVQFLRPFSKTVRTPDWDLGNICHQHFKGGNRSESTFSAEDFGIESY
jgi:molybdopterin-guanine dinucleotide biosynthesis protein A